MNTTYPLNSIITSIMTTKNIIREDVTCTDVKDILLSNDDTGSKNYNINFLFYYKNKSFFYLVLILILLSFL